MVTGVELLLGAVIGWAVRKARRVGGRVDGQVDEALDAGVDRLGELVAGKLGADPALVKLESEAAAGEVSQRTRDRVRLAVEDARHRMTRGRGAHVRSPMNGSSS